MFLLIIVIMIDDDDNDDLDGDDDDGDLEMSLISRGGVEVMTIMIVMMYMSIKLMNIIIIFR